MARSVRKSRVKEVPLSEVKDDLSRYLREAEEEPVLITRHGKPAGVLIGFEAEDDWFDYRLENDPRFFSLGSKRPGPAYGRGAVSGSRTCSAFWICCLGTTNSACWPNLQSDQ